MQNHSNTFPSASPSKISPVSIQMGVAVLALFCALALPNLERMNESPETTKNRQNAQSILTVANAASAAGVVFPNLEAAINALTSDSGISPASGPLAQHHYRVSKLTPNEALMAMNFLDFVDGMLVYKSL